MQEIHISSLYRASLLRDNHVEVTSLKEPERTPVYTWTTPVGTFEIIFDVPTLEDLIPMVQQLQDEVATLQRRIGKK